MLYVTTRDNRDAYTPHRTLRENRGPDGGFYVPRRLPVFSAEELQAMGQRGFQQTTAEILNLFFGTKLSGRDLDLAVGKQPVRLSSLRQRIWMGECWHNLSWEFSGLVKNLAGLLREEGSGEEPSDWASLAVRTAVLCGIFSELIREEIATPQKPVDFSCVCGDFSGPMSAWYARRMGFPVGNILCCCNENNAVWELFCHGQLRTDSVAVSTIVPEADVAVPAGLERLIHETAGQEEVNRFAECLRTGTLYRTDGRLLPSQGMYIMVSSTRRVAETVSSVYSTDSKPLSPHCALCYAGLQDYRAKTGSLRNALIFGEKSALCHMDFVSGVLDMKPETLKNAL